MVGMGTDNTDSGYRDIDCALYCEKGKLAAYASGARTNTFGTYKESNVLAVMRRGSTITFHQDGVELATCPKSLSGRVIADVSLHRAGGGGIVYAHWLGGVTRPRMSDVIWKSLNCAASGPKGQLTKFTVTDKDTCTKGWTGGAFSRRYAPADITLEFQCSVQQNAMVRCVGVLQGNVAVPLRGRNRTIWHLCPARGHSSPSNVFVILLLALELARTCHTRALSYPT